VLTDWPDAGSHEQAKGKLTEPVKRVVDKNQSDEHEYHLIYALRNGPGESGSAVDHLVTPETLG
jgi:hypothetical protein